MATRAVKHTKYDSHFLRRPSKPYFLPKDEGQFLREGHSGRATLRVEGNADKFAQVLSWSELNSFLSRGGGNLSRVNVTSGGERLTDTLYSRIGVSGTPHVQAGEVGALLLQGAVIHVEAAEEVFNSVSAICDSVGSRLETAVRASIWASWREQVPYSLWNDHDVIVPPDLREGAVACPQARPPVSDRSRRSKGVRSA